VSDPSAQAEPAHPVNAEFYDSQYNAAADSSTKDLKKNID